MVFLSAGLLVGQVKRHHRRWDQQGVIYGGDHDARRLAGWVMLCIPLFAFWFMYTHLACLYNAQLFLFSVTNMMFLSLHT